MSYYPINFLDRNDCEKKVKLGKKIGRGAYGSVYEACRNGDCHFIVKVIVYKKEYYENSGHVESLCESTIKKSWENEVMIHLKLNECQSRYNTILSPIIYDAWYCKEKEETTFFIVMERYDGNLIDFLSTFKTVKEKKVARIAVDQALQKLDFSLKMIHVNCSICLNDIKLENILYKKNGEFSYSFIFADFGISSANTTLECQENDSIRFQRNIEKFMNEL